MRAYSFDVYLHLKRKKRYEYVYYSPITNKIEVMDENVHKNCHRVLDSVGIVYLGKQEKSYSGKR